MVRLFVVAWVIALLSVAAKAAEHPKPVLVHFTATWCGPCQLMKPAVARVKRQGFDIRVVDIDEHPEHKKSYRVKGVPTTVCVVHRNGKWYEVGRIEKRASAAELRKMCERSVVKK